MHNREKILWGLAHDRCTEVGVSEKGSHYSVFIHRLVPKGEYQKLLELCRLQQKTSIGKNPWVLDIFALGIIHGNDADNEWRNQVLWINERKYKIESTIQTAYLLSAASKERYIEKNTKRP